MAQRLCHALRNADHSSSIVTTTPPPVSTSPTSTATLCQSTAALSIPSTIPPPLNLTRPIMSMSAAMSTIPPPAVTSEVFISARIAATADLSHEPSNPTSYSGRSQPNSSRNTQSVTHEIQLSAAAIPSQLANTSDNLSPTSTLDTLPPPRCIVTATQMIQPTYYTTLPLQNLLVTVHDQQFSLTQQILAWPTAYIPSSTVPLPPAASYPQSFHCHCFMLETKQ